MRLRLLLSLALLPAFACGDAGRGGGGTVIIGAAADVDALLPGIVRGTQGRAVAELLFDRIADLGPSLVTIGDSGFEPRLARRWSWSNDSLQLTLEFNPDARWHDGTPVTSADYAFALKTVRAPELGSNIAPDVSSIDSISTPDARTAVVHFARRDAEQFFAASLLVPLPKHLLDSIAPADLRTHEAARAPVGNGQFRFVAWEPDVRVEIVAVDDHYRGRPKLDRLIFAKSADPASGVARIWAGETDHWEPLTPDQLAEAEKHAHVRVITGPGYDYGFLAFNFRAANGEAPHPVLAERELRRALTAGIDRAAIVRTLFDTLASVGIGPQVRAQATSDTTVRQIAFNRAAANATLDSLGWRRGRDSIRVRNGRPLRFSILVPSSSVMRQRASALLQDQFRQIGADVRVESLEFQSFLERMNQRRFDAIIGTWRTTPSARGIRSTWGSPAIAGSSAQNAGRYVNPDFDAAVTRALSALTLEERRRELRTAYEIINDDAAAIWLFESRSTTALHRRIQTPAWRTDAWWMTVGSWSIPSDQRLPRDAALTP